MAETEQITILKLRTEGAETVKDLRNNVKDLKKIIEETKVDSDEYSDALKLLKVNQNALKDSMYASTTTMEDLKKSAEGTSNTYNALVHRMADLKSQLRSTDVSVEGGREKFEDLAKQINEVNNTLKEMDELQGSFSRNVGNYPGTIKTWSGSLDALDKSLKATSGGLGNVKNGMDAISVHPIIGILGIIIALFGSLTDNVKESETGMAALNEASLSLKPILNFFKGILEKIVGIAADLIGKVSEFVSSNGLINKLLNGIVGVGNAIVQFVVAPFKGVIEAIKIFKEQGIKGLGDASRAFANEMKNGVSFKSNFEAGQSIVDGIISGVKDKKPKAEKEVKKVGEDIGKKLAEGIRADFEKALAKLNKELEEEWRAKVEWQKFADDLMLEEEERFNSEMDKYWQEQEEMRLRDLQDAEEKAKAKITAMQTVVSATSGILGTLADLYESDEKNSEKNANKVKALRIASAMIDTISGAIGAFTQASESIPPPYGQIVGAASASLVTATGLAQIAKIKSTKVSGSASNSSPSAPGVTSAPAMSMEIPKVRSVTSASEEDRLNQMASDQRVVLVMSDLEVKTNQSKVQVAESSF